MGLAGYGSTTRILVAGSDAIWFESDTVPTFTKITLSEVDTSDALIMFEAFQKAFIVNGSNLKVADFINVKLIHSELDTAHAKGDILTQAATSAQMIVDFTDATKEHTYGYVTSGTFNTTAITGSGSGSPFTPSEVTNPSPQPHWYNWTAYPGGTSGTMPAIAYLGCLYRGRLVLSGNINYPYQWYMSRVGNPWDWAYTANDAQTAVAGGNSDAGETGDIIRSLIPYKDEYLIFGCANSIWVLRGDPASGGSLEEVDLTVGMFGAKSWCFDGAGNLYFMSTRGLHRVPNNLGSAEPISEPVLPNLGKDEHLDPALYRVSLEYDAARYGILICITLLATGKNSNYFYDLRTEGIFPETYPNSCGAYSLLYYNASDDENRELLIGCTDGYVRKFDVTEKNDVGTVSDTPITSSVVLPLLLNEDDDREIRMTSLTVTAAGGNTGGAEEDTDKINVNLYSGTSAEAVLEAIEDAAVPQTTVALTGAGKQSRIRNRIRGHSIAVELKNSTSDSTWAVERVAADVESVGKVRK